ncbi:MAG: ATP-binding cassette domain-containing protein [Cytophagaceae bacterium]|nr:ATP-binding cassette domain-containing protein [Cytophagaceae bacterium]
MIECQSISYRKDNKFLIQSVSFSMPPGSFTALLGPNGDGKSTVLKCASGELNGYTGEIYIQGIPLPRWNVLPLAQTRAVLSQQILSEVPYSAVQVVEMGRFAFRQSDTKAQRQWHIQNAMQRADVWRLKNRNYSSLSGGEQQRVQLARVLAQLGVAEEDLTGKILFLDEPASSLDLHQQYRMVQMLNELCQRGLSVLAILHDINLAMQCSDYLLVLKAGSVRAQGPTSLVASAALWEEVFSIPGQVSFSSIEGKPHFVFSMQTK